MEFGLEWGRNVEGKESSVEATDKGLNEVIVAQRGKPAGARGPVRPPAVSATPAETPESEVIVGVSAPAIPRPNATKSVTSADTTWS